MRNKTKKNNKGHNAHNKHKINNKTRKANNKRKYKTQSTHRHTRIFTPYALKKGSYSPTINRDLETLQSIPRQELSDCNIGAAYKLKEPLKIGVPGVFYGETCFNYNTPDAKRFLLKNLSANKHVDIEKIVPPKQFTSNCWFNAMFVIFFVSDKGRKFFHFFRHLMIEGKQKDGTHIPHKLRDAFALLNFGVDACLTGNKYAYRLNTNVIIKEIYTAIPPSYKTSDVVDIYNVGNANNPSIYNVGKAGNPIYYYMSIINYLNSYLNNNSINMLLIRNAANNWKNQIAEKMKFLTHIPHIIVLEVYDKNALSFDNKPVSFTINGEKYQIDSAVVRDVSKQHFCSTITCEKKEYGYDGMSFHRMEQLEWKNKLNTNFDWGFEGTKDYDGTPLIWNYTKCYQLLLYYRI